MTSSFTWLDDSEQDKRRMLDAIELFAERDILDELGVGGLRDALADLLFPGTSTIQTRARYFLFIPWIYRQLEHKRVSSAAIGERARALELELTDQLRRAADHRGAFGIDAGANLTSAREKRRTEALGKGAARARLVVAAEATDSERELHRASTPGQITRMTTVPIVDPDAGGAAGWTASASHRPLGIEDNRLVVTADQANSKRTEGRWGEHSRAIRFR